MQSLKVDVTKLITQAQYAKKVGLTRQRINQMIRDGKLKTANVNGVVLVLQD